jgi:Ca2+-binding RTX toxin-like protein
MAQNSRLLGRRSVCVHLLLITVSLQLFGIGSVQAQPRPNVLVIVTDDRRATQQMRVMEATRHLIVPPQAATDQTKCAGKRATIVGTERRDNIVGTRRSDVIVTLGGDDTVDGMRGNDRICTGADRDMVLESHGDDTTDGGSGLDTLSFENSSGPIAADLDNAGLGLWDRQDDKG